MTMLDELAMKHVGIEGSPFFVTLVDKEVLGRTKTISTRTIASFISLPDAEAYAESFSLRPDEMIIIEGEVGIYREIGGSIL